MIGLCLWPTRPSSAFPWGKSTCHMHIAYVVKEVASFQGLSRLTGVEPFKKPLEYDVAILSIHVS